MSLHFVLPILFCLAVGAGPTHAALSITQSEVAYVDTFDSLNPFSSPYSTFGWTSTLGGTGNTLTYGTPGTNVPGAATPNTLYSLRPSASSTNYALGGKVAATGGLGSVAMTATNNTATPLTAFELSWEYVQYTAENRASTIAFSYSLDGVSWLTTGLSFSSGGATYTATGLTGSNTDFRFVSPAILTQSNLVRLYLTTPLSVGSSIQFRYLWTTGAGGGNNAHLGVDNVSIKAVPEPGRAGLALVCLLVFAGGRRRRAGMFA